MLRRIRSGGGFVVAVGRIGAGSNPPQKIIKMECVGCFIYRAPPDVEI